MRVLYPDLIGLLTISLVLVLFSANTIACSGPPVLVVENSDLPDLLKDEIGQVRLVHIEAEANFLHTFSTDMSCHVTVQFADQEEGRVHNYGPQSFSLTRVGQRYVIAANSSLGLLYGFYETLDDLGFIFATPDTVLFQSKSAPRIPEGRGTVISPKVKTRGLWAFGEDLDPAFLLWAGRNRFNLVGGSFPGGEHLFSVYGIRRWGGGHDVISHLVPSDKVVNGRALIESHPEWYGQKGSQPWKNYPNPIPTDAVTYRNPCFGEPDLVDYFADALAPSLIDGRYRDIDVLNIWPSDQPVYARDALCSEAPGASIDLDDLVFFYNRLVERLAADTRLRAAGRSVEIAGIGYYGTYDLSGTTLTLASTAGQASYIHYFFNNVRSYQQGLFDSASDSNQRLVGMLDATRDTHNLKQFGVVEYYNYSIYHSIVSPNTRLLREELSGLIARGMTDWAYMHPAVQPSPYHAALDYNLSRALFIGENPQTSIIRFATAYLGSGTERHHFDAFEAAISNQAEILGPETSLWLVQMADRYWASPLLDNDIILSLSKALLQGQSTILPPMRLTNWRAVRFTGQGLDESLRILRNLEDALAPQSESSLYATRRAAMQEEAKRARLILSLVRDAVLQRQALAQGNNAACQMAVQSYRTTLQILKTLHFPKKVSDFRDKNAIIDMYNNIFQTHLSGSCPE